MFLSINVASLLQSCRLRGSKRKKVMLTIIMAVTIIGIIYPPQSSSRHPSRIFGRSSLRETNDVTANKNMSNPKLAMRMPFVQKSMHNDTERESNLLLTNPQYKNRDRGNDAVTSGNNDYDDTNFERTELVPILSSIVLTFAYNNTSSSSHALSWEPDFLVTSEWNMSTWEIATARYIEEYWNNDYRMFDHYNRGSSWIVSGVRLPKITMNDIQVQVLDSPSTESFIQKNRHEEAFPSLFSTLFTTKSRQRRVNDITSTQHSELINIVFTCQNLSYKVSRMSDNDSNKVTVTEPITDWDVVSTPFMGKWRSAYISMLSQISEKEKMSAVQLSTFLPVIFGTVQDVAITTVAPEENMVAKISTKNDKHKRYVDMHTFVLVTGMLYLIVFIFAFHYIVNFACDLRAIENEDADNQEESNPRINDSLDGKEDRKIFEKVSKKWNISRIRALQRKKKVSSTLQISNKSDDAKNGYPMFISQNSYNNGDDRMNYRFEAYVPSGTLGIFIETDNEKIKNNHDQALIYSVNETSVLAGKVMPGDIMTFVNNDSVTVNNVFHVLDQTKNHIARKITFLRPIGRVSKKEVVEKESSDSSEMTDTMSNRSKRDLGISIKSILVDHKNSVDEESLDEETNHDNKPKKLKALDEKKKALGTVLCHLDHI